MKVLWIGDAIINSGFSIVTHNICDRLNSQCDLAVYGIGYNGLFKHNYKYFIYPANHDGDIYGFKHINKVVEAEEPDVIVLFNDDSVINNYYQFIQSTGARRIVFSPVNFLPLHADYVLGISNSAFNTSAIITYTEFSKSRVLDVSQVLPVESVYHGVDHDTFYPIEDAKDSLGLSDYFVVGNISTNTYRKRLDLFIKGFAEFARGKEDVKCLIHASNRDQAHNVAVIADYLNIADKVLFSKSPLGFDKLNLLYNLMDVNVNTSLGEGFGLPLLEGAACKVPILCPSHGNLVDIWSKGARFVKTQKRSESISGTNFEGKVIDMDDFVSKLNFMYNEKEARLQQGEEAYEHSFDNKFSWDEVSDKVFNIIKFANKDKIDIIL